MTIVLMYNQIVAKDDSHFRVLCGDFLYAETTRGWLFRCPKMMMMKMIVKRME